MDKETTETAEAILKNLSIEEKIRLLNGSGNWRNFTAGGKIPEIFMCDGPHGLRKQDDQNYSNINSSRTATCFPTGSALASSWNTKSAETLGTATGIEAQAENVNLVLGPAINIKRSPLCGRNFEYYSEDPVITGRMAENFVKGLKKTGTGACLKHFALNNQETLRQESDSICDQRTMHEIYLKAFETAVKTGPAAIMESYNLVNGKRVCSSYELLTEILRKKWEFKGAVISDWGACLNVPECVKAGLNLAMPDSSGYFQKQISEAFKNGKISEEEINSAAEQVIKLCLNLTEMRKNHPAENLNLAEIHEKNYLTALNLAEDSAVLLKNQEFFPLSPKKTPEIAVIGSFAEQLRYQGGGSSHINSEKYDNVIENLKKQGFKVLYQPGFKTEKRSSALLKKALKLAENACSKNIPLIFFCGLPDSIEGEGYDRTNLNLPEYETELLEKLTEITENLAVVNFSGAPVIIPRKEKIKAILQMYLAGEAAGQACAELIAGIAAPSGRLAETWPLSMETLPSQISKDFNAVYSEGVFTGYRYYETLNIPVQFEFGAGLSYTSFEYSDLKISVSEKNIAENSYSYNIEVSFTVKNTGNADGSEVLQLYVMPEQFKDEKEKRFLRPVTELKAFEKIFLKSGEAETVTMKLSEKDFSIFSVKTGSFVTIGGNYTISVNSSVKNQKLSEKILIKGEKLENHIFCNDANRLNRFSVQEPAAEAFMKKPSKGSYTLQDNLKTMAETSFFVRLLIFIFSTAIKIMNFPKKSRDPAVRIALSAVTENPVESLISTSGGMISEGFARKIVKIANGR